MQQPTPLLVEAGIGPPVATGGDGPAGSSKKQSCDSLWRAGAEKVRSGFSLASVKSPLTSARSLQPTMLYPLVPVLANEYHSTTGWPQECLEAGEVNWSIGSYGCWTSGLLLTTVRSKENVWKDSACYCVPGSNSRCINFRADNCPLFSCIKCHLSPDQRAPFLHSQKWTVCFWIILSIGGLRAKRGITQDTCDAIPWYFVLTELLWESQSQVGSMALGDVVLNASLPFSWLNPNTEILTITCMVSPKEQRATWGCRFKQKNDRGGKCYPVPTLPLWYI